ncbi:MAG: ABC transporter permease [Chloroflexaceae bacterium]|nr:ABC transporter permease [Chloroflexaceae bacterium]
MFNLLQAEWIKLSRRPMAHILLAIFLVLLLLSLILYYVVIGFHEGTLTGGLGTITFLDEAQIQQYRQQLQFPGIYGAVFNQINASGGILAIVLAAGAMGSEYGWGTLRVQLARQPRRGRFLIAKVLVLLLVVLIAMAIALVLGTIAAIIFGFFIGEIGSLTLGQLLLLPVSMLQALLVMLPYVMVTMAMSIMGRSVLAGMAGGVIFLLLDVSLGALSFLAEMGGPFIFLYNLLIQQNINALVVANSSYYGLDTAAISPFNLELLPHPLQAAVVVLVYSGLFFGYAYFWFVRHDIFGAA